MAREAVCKVGDIPVNGMKQFGEVCVLNAGKRFFACQSACPHEGVPLCDGAFDGEVLTCLEHLWGWNLAEGGTPQGLAEKELEMREVEVEGDVVYVIS